MIPQVINTVRIAVAAAAAWLVPYTALAHPHVYAEATLEVAVAPDGTVNSLGHVWRFDDLFSSTVLLEFDKNQDLRLDEAELREVAEVVQASLADFNYFQIVKANGKDVAMRAPERMIASFDNEQLSMMFESRPASPLKLSGKVDFGVYDPTFYTAIDFAEDGMLTVAALPAGCGSRVIRPDSEEAIAQNQDTLTEEFFNDPTGNDLSSIYATRLEVDCSGEAVAAVAAPAAPRGSGSSLGIGTNEATLPSTGLFAGVFNWMNTQQQDFYRALTGAMKSMREGGGGLWLLVGLSFAYGIFHAAGPGHGKAVISSYMLANEVALRRGIMLSFVSAFLQAASAIVLMGAVYLALHGTSVSMTDATRFLEIASYALITAFGSWLLWRKAGPRVAMLFGRAPAHSLSAASASSHVHDHAHHDHVHRHDGHDHGSHGHHHHGHHAHAHAHGDVCETCGHSHAPDPALLAGRKFDWRTAWAAVAAVGIRPCTGALIVLSFAFLNGLVFGGVVSVLAMALGTAITVSVLATIAVTAKNWAVAFAGDGRMGNRVHATIEIGGAAFVFLIGATLLSASLAA